MWGFSSAFGSLSVFGCDLANSFIYYQIVILINIYLCTYNIFLVIAILYAHNQR